MVYTLNLANNSILVRFKTRTQPFYNKPAHKMELRKIDNTPKHKLEILTSRGNLMIRQTT